MHDYTTTRTADGIWVLGTKAHDDTFVTVSTHPTEAEALTALVAVIVEEKRVLQSNLDRARNSREGTERLLTSLQTLVEGLPWEDINSGNFSPQQGCGDVAAFRTAAVDLGCDASTINYGAERDFVIMAEVTLRVSFSLTANSEENAHDLAELALESCNWHHDGSLDDFYIDDVRECVEDVNEC